MWKTNILGQDYKLVLIDESEDKDMKGKYGEINMLSKVIKINNAGLGDNTIPYENLREYSNSTVRHELIHAYFHESGLSDYCDDEVLVEFLALQIPKITRTLNTFYDNQDDFYSDGIRKEDRNQEE